MGDAFPAVGRLDLSIHTAIFIICVVRQGLVFLASRAERLTLILTKNIISDDCRGMGQLMEKNHAKGETGEHVEVLLAIRKG